MRHQCSGKKAGLLVTVSTMLLRRSLVRACYLSLTFAVEASALRTTESPQRAPSTYKECGKRAERGKDV